AIGAKRLPAFLFQLLEGARRRLDLAAMFAEIPTLAVDGHGGGDNQFSRMRPGIQNRLQQVRSSLVVDGRVFGDLVHGLAHADGSGKVVDHIHPPNRSGQGSRIAYVSAYEFRFRRKVVGNSRRMNLLAEIIENANLMPALDQRIGGMRTNESGASRNQNLFTIHLPLLLLSRTRPRYFRTAL